MDNQKRFSVMLDRRHRAFLVWASAKQASKPTLLIRALVHREMQAAMESEDGSELKSFIEAYKDEPFSLAKSHE